METGTHRLNEEGGGALLIIGLISYLLISSLIIAYFFTEQYNEHIENEIDIGSYAWKNTTTQSYNVTCDNTTWYVVRRGMWECQAGVGLVSSGGSLNEVGFTILPGATETYINNTYELYNPNNLEYDLIIRDAKYICLDPNYLCGLYSLFNDWMFAKATTDGWVKDEGIPDIDTYQSGVDITLDEELTVLTVYNTEYSYGELYVDGGLIFHDTHLESAQQPMIVKYTGLVAYGNGLVLREWQSELNIAPPVTDWSNPISLFVMFLEVLLYNIPEVPGVFVLPWWLNVIFIKIPGIGLIWKMMEFFRGTG